MVLSYMIFILFYKHFSHGNLYRLNRLSEKSLLYNSALFMQVAPIIGETNFPKWHCVSSLFLQEL
jgi:hypothetical protein